jgi:hypothetical protein
MICDITAALVWQFLIYKTQSNGEIEEKKMLNIKHHISDYLTVFNSKPLLLPKQGCFVDSAQYFRRFPKANIR